LHRRDDEVDVTRIPFLPSTAQGPAISHRQVPRWLVAIVPARALRAFSRTPVVPKMVITHAVVDLERWLEGNAERAAVIGSFGTDVTDYVAAYGSNNIAITADVIDVAGAQAMMTSPSPDTAAAMERHGVIPPLMAYIEK
jgi:hypothetical protein